jgi:AMP-polyphosphate phosphotransferase
MFETAEVGATLSDAAFSKVRDRLRLKLIELQQQLRAADFPTVIILHGVQGAGVVDTLNLLNTWMDPRWIATTAFDEPSDEEQERPLFWRYWRSLPPAGTIGLYLGGWYTDPIIGHTRGKMSRNAFDDCLLRIKAFERTLAEEGALILKFWLHLSEKDQKQRIQHNRKDPLVGLRASDTSWTTPTKYAAYTKTASYALRNTMDGKTPWFIIEGGDDNFRRASVLTILAEHLEKHLAARHKLAKAKHKAQKKQSKAKSVAPDHRRLKAPVRRVLDALDMTQSMSDSAYAKAFHDQQLRLHELQKQARQRGLSTIVALEGWDAAGKGGAIRRLTFAMNARDYRIVPVAAPTDEERAHHYLWRFWRHLGRAGRMTIFDRSWYGRVLVERVENLIDEDTWMRGYAEINDFEQQLAEHGSVVVKMWLHISKKEQLRRFKDRSTIAHKKWKLTDDDWRNREKWDQYEEAINDMVSRTSTTAAPWHLIPSNDKRFTRVRVLKTVADSVEKALSAARRKPE